MYLDDGDADGTDAVGEGDGGVGIATRVHHDGITSANGLLQFVNHDAFVVGLEIVNLMLRESATELGDEFFEGNVPVDFRLSLSDEVEIGTVENEDFHSIVSLIRHIHIA